MRRLRNRESSSTKLDYSIVVTVIVTGCFLLAAPERRPGIGESHVSISFFFPLYLSISTLSILYLLSPFPLRLSFTTVDKTFYTQWSSGQLNLRPKILLLLWKKTKKNWVRSSRSPEGGREREREIVSVCKRESLWRKLSSRGHVDAICMILSVFSYFATSCAFDRCIYLWQRQNWTGCSRSRADRLPQPHPPSYPSWFKGCATFGLRFHVRSTHRGPTLH